MYKKATFKKSEWVIDSLRTHDIYYFYNIDGNSIFGIRFYKNSKKTTTGEYYIDRWIFQQKAYPGRYLIVDFTDITSKRKRNILEGVFNL